MKKEKRKKLKEAKKFLWIIKEFQNMNRKEQNKFIRYLEGKIENMEVMGDIENE